MIRLAVLLALCGIIGSARADVGPPPAMNAVRVDEHLGTELPGDIDLIDSEGRPLRLDAALGAEHPSLLVLGYYRCQMLCGLVLSTLARSLRESTLRAGRDINVVAVSIAPDETPEEARRRAQQVLGPDAAGETGWKFLVGNAAGVQRLAAAVGFHYQYDPQSRQYAHAAVLVAVTPARRISGYLYGFGPSPEELERVVHAAAAGQEAPVFERILLHCFRYTPALRRYAGSIALALKATGMLILVGLGTVIVLARRREVHG